MSQTEMARATATLIRVHDIGRVAWLAIYLFWIQYIICNWVQDLGACHEDKLQHMSQQTHHLTIECHSLVRIWHQAYCLWEMAVCQFGLVGVALMSDELTKTAPDLVKRWAHADSEGLETCWHAEKDPMVRICYHILGNKSMWSSWLWVWFVEWRHGVEVGETTRERDEKNFSSEHAVSFPFWHSL